MEEGDNKHIQQSLLAEADRIIQSIPNKQHQKNNKYLNKLPTINGSNPLSTLFFGWLYRFISYGARQTVKVDSMPQLPEEMQCWKGLDVLQNNFEEMQRSERSGFTLIRLLAKTYAKQFLAILAYISVYIAMETLSPFLTAVIMRYISHRDEYESYQGGLLFGLTLLLQIVRAICNTQMNYRFVKLGINLTNSLTLLIFNKSLRYPSVAQKQFRESDIINYSQVDAERLSSGGFEIAVVILAPIQIVVGILMMYYFIGVSFLAGIGVMCLTIGSTYFTSKWSYHYNSEILTKKDQRMKVTQEMFDIIRYIKINAIEKFFYNKVDEKRMQEINLYRKKGFMDVLTIFIYWLACPLILSATFTTYILLGNEMSSEVAFTTIMIFTTLQFPIRILPMSISSIIQIFTSIKRIEKYLYSQEIQTKHIQYIDDSEIDYAVMIERGNFKYAIEKDDNKRNDKNQGATKQGKQQRIKNDSDKTEKQRISINQEHQEIDHKESIISSTSELALQKEEEKYVCVLRDVDMKIKKGHFTIVVGDIGSGKSSLLMAILNQMIADFQSKIEVNGSIAYCAQKPWIMSATVRDNITFELPFDQEKFNTVIHFASLEDDLKILPFGVETQIGEKGINISGGQKARIALARALYSGRDIYLLDDVLSAVDVHVGQFLMRETLRGYLRGKTIIMPTHAIKFAEIVDEIIVMEKGKVVRKGHFRDICNTVQFQNIFQKEQKKAKQAEEEEESHEKASEQSLSLRQQNLVVSANKSGVTEASKLLRQLMLPEDQEVGQIDFKIFKEYIKLNGGYFNFAFLICLVMTLWIAFTTASSIVIEKWCQNPIGQGYDLYIYIGLIVSSNIFIFFRAYTLIMSGARQGQIVHRRMMKSLLYASLGDFYNRIPIGRIINRLTKDLRELDQVIGFAIGNVLVDFFLLVGTLVICIYGSTVLILIPIAIVGYLTYRFRKYYMKTQIEVARFQKSTNSPIVSGFISTISGLSTIRAYRTTAEFLNKQMKNLDINKRVRLTKSGIESWFSINLTYLSFFINMVSVGYCILSDNPNASLAGLLMNYAITLSSTIRSFTNDATVFESKVVALERIYAFTKIEPQLAYLEYINRWSHIEEGFQEVIKRGDIEFRGMYARYRQDLPEVLKGLSLSIKAGQKIGIVGRTGAGKTTIINTLLRITEISKGDLLIDGVKIQDYLIKNLRFGITMIDQEPTLIKSTFRQNLDITGKYSDEELYQILKECNLYETIMEKGGLDAPVSNDSLSAGEKQLLCICRAFLKHSKIVLVDEATANIDVKNDAIIQQVIREKFKNCTVLTIAHRLSTLAKSDRILVMEKGQVVQFGSPEELQAKDKGIYREMVLKNAKQFLI